jgi:hypothetical protein
MIARMAAPDEEPIVPRRRPFPLWVKHYGGPSDPYVVVFDRFDERGFVHRQTKMRASLQYISISGTIDAGAPTCTAPAKEEEEPDPAWDLIVRLPLALALFVFWALVGRPW